MMNEPKKQKAWMAMAIVLLVVCLVQGGFILGRFRDDAPPSDIFRDPDKFSSFLDKKLNKEKNENRKLFDHFFDDNFFSGRTDPFEEMERLHRQMEDMIGNSIRDRFNNSWNGWFGDRFFDGSGDIDFEMKEKNDTFIYTITIPNLKENKLNIDIEKDGIKIEGEFSQNIERKDSAGNIVGKHEIKQSLSKRIPIPDGADYSNAKIDTKNNRITIRLPKMKS